MLLRQRQSVSAKTNPSENRRSLKELVLQRTGAAADGPYVFLKPKKTRGLDSPRFYTGSNAIIRMDAKRPIVPDTNLSLFALALGPVQQDAK